MSATLMMAAMNKNNEKMTVTINGGGPIGTMMAVTRGDGHIKGFVGDPHVHYTYNDTGHLAVGVAVGTQGTLQVIKQMKSYLQVVLLFNYYQKLLKKIFLILKKK